MMENPRQPPAPPTGGGSPAETAGAGPDYSFNCHICREPSSEICHRCTRDACGNHICERCLRLQRLLPVY